MPLSDPDEVQILSFETDGRTVRLRCVVRPDRAQAILLDHLGLILPQRLSLLKGISQM
jgi:hypothetical protein